MIIIPFIRENDWFSLKFIVRISIQYKLLESPTKKEKLKLIGKGRPREYKEHTIPIHNRCGTTTTTTTSTILTLFVVQAINKSTVHIRKLKLIFSLMLMPHYENVISFSSLTGIYYMLNTIHLFESLVTSCLVILRTNLFNSCKYTQRHSKSNTCMVLRFRLSQ